MNVRAGLLLLALALPARAEVIYVTALVDEPRIFTLSSTALAVPIHDVALVGMPPPRRVIALDVRPSTGQLYAVVGACISIDCQSQLATIDPETGSVSLFPNFSGLETNLDLGFEIDPILDRGRIITPEGGHFIVDLDSGAIVGTATPPSGAPALEITAIAYTPVASAPAQTTLFALNAAEGTFGRLGGPGGTPSPDLGVFQTLSAPTVDFTTAFGFDISASGEALFTTNGSTPFIVGGNGGPDCPAGFPAVAGLHQLDLATGATTHLGTLGVCGGVSSFAIGRGAAPAPVVVPALDALGVAALAVSLVLVALFALRRRRV